MWPNSNIHLRRPFKVVQCSRAPDRFALGSAQGMSRRRRAIRLDCSGLASRPATKRVSHQSVFHLPDRVRV
jgi:hypothetical protein